MAMSCLGTFFIWSTQTQSILADNFAWEYIMLIGMLRRIAQKVFHVCDKVQEI